MPKITPLHSSFLTILLIGPLNRVASKPWKPWKPLKYPGKKNKTLETLETLENPGKCLEHPLRTLENFGQHPLRTLEIIFSYSLETLIK